MNYFRLVCFCVVFLAALPTQAANIIYSYTGTITSGGGFGDFVGTEGQQLSGTIFFDDATAGVADCCGGTNYAGSLGNMGFTLTANGTTYSDTDAVWAGAFRRLSVDDNSGFTFADSITFSIAGGPVPEFQILLSDSSQTALVDESIPLLTLNGFTDPGDFATGRLSLPTGEVFFNLDSIAPVPLPPALLLFGSALAGLLWRRKRG